ncbi:TetR/AcrR family transcriptional regulator [Williamsia sp. 1138]|uniref:TetR/AcrR family transcriptional regulator n=1 Tax=Williamsia sp. 1138 TaxID=1903117 RepID=UPI00143DC1DE|nr:TetR/AcrR family transcriptional regulator [Williamsia sp. 1138]
MTLQDGSRSDTGIATAPVAPTRPSQQEKPTTQRGWRTRGALVAAARELFEEKGFRDTRISDIAERSGTSYGTFYHYFETKDDVLHELFSVVAGEMFTASQTTGAVGDDAITKIEAANRQYFTAAARNARLIAVIDEMAIRDDRFRTLKLQIRDLFLRRNEAGIRHLQRTGDVEPSLDPTIAAAALGGMIEHFTQMWFIHGAKFDEDAAITTLTRLWSQALGLK